MSQKKDLSKRIRYCVLICESLYNDFENTSPFIELGNYTAIDYTINWLVENDIEEIFLFYSNHKQQVEDYHSQVSLVDVKLHLNYMKPSELKSFGDVMREVNFRDLLSEDFIILYADNIANFNFNEMVNSHFDKKVDLKNVVLTTAMRKGTSSQIHILNSSTNQILQIQNQTNKAFSLNTDKVNLKKTNVDFRRDLVPLDIFICTIEVLKSFKQTYEYQTMQDFIIGMLTSQVYQEKIITYEIKHNEVSYRLNKVSNIYHAYMNFVCGYLNPYTIYHDDRMSKFNKNHIDRQFTVGRFNKILRKGVKISDSSVISNNVYVGQSTQIQNHCNISKSVVGKNCHIKDNVSLVNCIILDGCTISTNSQLQYCLIEKVNQTFKIHNFKYQILEQFPRFVDRQLFLQTPPAELATFEEQLEALLHDKPEEETILVSELTRIRRQFEKNQKQFTKNVVKILKPQGVKGIQSLTKVWGTVLFKTHHQDEQDLINSLYYSCVNIEEYQKAFHLLLQYFYHYQILTKQSIIQWFKSTESDTPTYKLCKAFIDKLQEQSDEEEEGDDDN